MALPTFTFTPSFSVNFTERPRTVTTRLGDGFVYRKPTGMRPLVRTWQLRFNVRRLEEIKPLLDFLREREGYKKFHWTPPEPDNVPGVWVATSWRPNRSNGHIYGMTVTLEEQ